MTEDNTQRHQILERAAALAVQKWGSPTPQPNRARRGASNGNSKCSDGDAWAYAYMVRRGECPRPFMANYIAGKHEMTTKGARKVADGRRYSQHPGHTAVQNIRQAVLKALEPYGYTYGLKGRLYSRLLRALRPLGNTAWGRAKVFGLRSVFRSLKPSGEQRQALVALSPLEQILEKDRQDREREDRPFSWDDLATLMGSQP